MFRNSTQARKPLGQYRTVPRGTRTPMVYVSGGGVAVYVTEAMYRAKAFSPSFEELPTEKEYDARS